MNIRFDRSKTKLTVKNKTTHTRVEDITTMGRREAKTPTEWLEQHMGD
jgi:hypothetical protein